MSHATRLRQQAPRFVGIFLQLRPDHVVAHAIGRKRKRRPFAAAHATATIVTSPMASDAPVEQVASGVDYGTAPRQQLARARTLDVDLGVGPGHVGDERVVALEVPLQVGLHVAVRRV